MKSRGILPIQVTKMRIASKIILLVFFVLAVSGRAMAQADYCHVLISWVDRQTGHSTSLFNVGDYCADPNPDDSPFLRTFVHAESGIKINVGVDYYTRTLEKNTIWMRMGMRFVDKAESEDDHSNKLDVFFSVNSVYAETIRDKHWKVLEVSKFLSKDGKDYHLLFTCAKHTKLSRKIIKCDSAPSK